MFPSLRAVARRAPLRLPPARPLRTGTGPPPPKPPRGTISILPPRPDGGGPPRRHRVLYTDPTGHRLLTAEPLFTRSSFHRAARSRLTYLLLSVTFGSAALFYFSHLETVPVTGRTRFNMYSSPSKAATVRAAGDSQMRHVLYQLAQQGVTPLPGWHPASRRVRRVLDRLLPFSGLEGEAWEVFVIPTAEQNAFVLPGGKVFVHAGILEVAGGDAGLAAVLGHEIAHNVADHVGERMSAAVGTDVLLYGMMLVVGMVGFGPMLMHYFGGRLLEVAFGRPMSRVQEREADYIGLMMMSEACYDPREAVGFWERMMRRGGKEEPPEWLSTHPSNERRVEAMREWLPVAMEKRANSDCRTTASFAEGFRRALGRGVIVVY